MKTVRLETVFSSFQKQGCFCGFHRFLYLIPADIMLFLLIFASYFIVPGVYVKTSSALWIQQILPVLPSVWQKSFCIHFSETVIHTRLEKSFFRASGFPHIPQDCPQISVDNSVERVENYPLFTTRVVIHTTIPHFVYLVYHLMG